MERQRAKIRGGLVDYDKVAGDTPFGEARQSLSLDPSMLRTQAQKREEQRSIYATQTAEFLNLNTIEKYALDARERALKHKKLNIEQQLLNANTPKEKEAAIAALRKDQYQQAILNADATAATTFADGLKELTTIINRQYRLSDDLGKQATNLGKDEKQNYSKDIQLGRTQAMVNALFSIPQEAISLVQYDSFGAGGVSEDMFEAAKKHVQIFRQGQRIAGSAASAYEKYMAGAKAVLGDSYNQETVDVLAKQFLPPDQFVAFSAAKAEEGKRKENIEKRESKKAEATGTGTAVDATPEPTKETEADRQQKVDNKTKEIDRLKKLAYDIQREIYVRKRHITVNYTNKKKDPPKEMMTRIEELEANLIGVKEDLSKFLAVKSTPPITNKSNSPEASMAEPLVPRRSEQTSDALR